MKADDVAGNTGRPPEASAASEILVRMARPDDAPCAAELIYLPMGKLGDYLFGFDDAARAKQVLAALFAQEGSRFSYQFSDVLEVNGHVAGLLLGYPVATLKKTELPMARQLHALFGVSGMWRFLRRSLPLMRYKEAEPDEFYIFTLAVDPGFQDGGLGSKLLAHAQAKARISGLTKCSLGVTVDNERAIHFYKEHGFEIVETVRMPPLERAFGYPGYHRMVKDREAGG